MNFFGMGPMEIMVIMVIALIVFGPGKLPEIGAQVGRAVKDFRSATSELTGEFERTMKDVEAAADEVKASAQEVQTVTREAVSLDQAMSPATKPAKPLPHTGANQSIQSQPVIGQAQSRVPSKADPLADLMGSSEPSVPATNGHAPLTTVDKTS